MCKISLCSAAYILHYSVLNFHRISNTIEICLVGRAPAMLPWGDLPRHIPLRAFSVSTCCSFPIQLFFFFSIFLLNSHAHVNWNINYVWTKFIVNKWDIGLYYRVSSKSQPQNSSTFQDFFKAFLLNSRPLSTQILCILQKYFYIRDCKIWSIELFHTIIHDYDIILSPKKHSDIERGLHFGQQRLVAWWH